MLLRWLDSLKVNRRMLQDLFGKENEVLIDIKTINIRETNNIINATTTFVPMKLGRRYGDNKKREKNCGGRK